MTKYRTAFLPALAVSMLALAACGGDTDAPDPVNPDAGVPPQEQVEPETPAVAPEVEMDAEVEGEAPADLQQQIDAVQQEAEQTFESIRQDAEQAGQSMTETGGDMLDSLTDQMQATSETLESQIDSIVAAAAAVRDDTMSDEQKLEMVENSRAAAEQAARLLGNSEADITAAGDETEQRVRAALDI